MTMSININTVPVPTLSSRRDKETNYITALEMISTVRNLNTD